MYIVILKCIDRGQAREVGSPLLIETAREISATAFPSFPTALVSSDRL